MEKAQSLITLKHLLQAIEPTSQPIATPIGLLACSGLNPNQQMPEMCYLLARQFNLSSCGFFWADADGNMQDAWCSAPEFLSFTTLMNCLAYQESGDRVWPSFQENMKMGAIAGYLLPFQNKRFYESPHFAQTYARIDGHHILDLVLHDGVTGFGAFLMMRSKEQGPFKPDERHLLEATIPLINQAFSNQNDSNTQYAEKETVGFAILDAQGSCMSLSEEAKRIVWTLSHTTPGSFASPDDPSIEIHLQQLIKRLLGTPEGRLCSAEHPISIDNRWGRFSVAFETEKSTQRLTVTLARKVPLASRLALSLAKLNLSPMRQIVAWLLAQNTSRNEISQFLNISLETTTSHIKYIYRQLDVSSSHGLLLKLT
jgi:DNA-binding CsgD family transcriptional regulator